MSIIRIEIKSFSVSIYVNMVKMELCLMFAVSMGACGDTIPVASLIFSPFLILGFPKYSCSKSIYLAAFKL